MKMKSVLAVTLIALALAGCTTGLSNANLEPIPGSITYTGQPRTKLTKSPVGSTFTHNFRRWNGDRVIETYQIQPDRSVKIIDRRIIRDWLTFGGDD